MRRLLVFRVECPRCGLWYRYIEAGGRGFRDFSDDEFGRLCAELAEKLQATSTGIGDPMECATFRAAFESAERQERA